MGRTIRPSYSPLLEGTPGTLRRGCSSSADLSMDYMHATTLKYLLYSI